MLSDFPPHVQAKVQRILNAEAQRLADRVEEKRVDPEFQERLQQLMDQERAVPDPLRA